MKRVWVVYCDYRYSNGAIDEKIELGVYESHAEAINEKIRMEAEFEKEEQSENVLLYVQERRMTSENFIIPREAYI